MWKLVVDNDVKYTARPGVRIVTNFVMRSRARLRRGEGTPPYGMYGAALCEWHRPPLHSLRGETNGI